MPIEADLEDFSPGRVAAVGVRGRLAEHGNERLIPSAARRFFDACGRPDGAARSGVREDHALGRLCGREVRISLSPAPHAPWQIAVC